MAFLAVPGPFDLALTTERFRVFGVDRATLWHEDGLHRVVGGRELRIEAASGGVDVEPLDAQTEPVVRALLGLDFDLEPFYLWAADHELLADLVPRLAGFRPSLAPEPFEMLVGAIAAQQVSLFSALAIRNRLVERFGSRVGEAWAFPARETLAAVPEEELVALGFSRAKAAYVVGLARDAIDLHGLAALPDDEVRARLVALRGIGEWTAEWFLGRHLGRPHAWPAGDLALRKAVAPLHVDEARIRFHPFENLSAHYLLLSRRMPGSAKRPKPMRSSSRSCGMRSTSRSPTRPGAIRTRRTSIRICRFSRTTTGSCRSHARGLATSSSTSSTSGPPPEGRAWGASSCAPPPSMRVSRGPMSSSSTWSRTTRAHGGSTTGSASPRSSVASRRPSTRCSRSSRTARRSGPFTCRPTTPRACGDTQPRLCVQNRTSGSAADGCACSRTRPTPI